MIDTGETGTIIDTSQFSYNISGSITATSSAAASLNNSSTVYIEAWATPFLGSDGWPDPSQPSAGKWSVTYNNNGTSYSETHYSKFDAEDYHFFAYVDTQADGNYYDDIRGAFDGGNGLNLSGEGSSYTVDIELDVQ